MLKAVNIKDALKNRPVLQSRSQATTEAEAEAAFARLHTYEDGGVFAGRFIGQSPWERHRNGDELVQVLEGRAVLSVLIDGGQEQLELSAGTVAIVPRGCWHRFDAPDGVTLLTKTPQPTDHTWDLEDLE